jgi:hypothetical protein
VGASASASTRPPGRTLLSSGRWVLTTGRSTVTLIDGRTPVNLPYGTDTWGEKLRDNCWVARNQERQ